MTIRYRFRCDVVRRYNRDWYVVFRPRPQSFVNRYCTPRVVILITIATGDVYRPDFHTHAFATPTKYGMNLWKTPGVRNVRPRSGCKSLGKRYDFRRRDSSRSARDRSRTSPRFRAIQTDAPPFKRHYYSSARYQREAGSVAFSPDSRSAWACLRVLLGTIQQHCTIIFNSKAITLVRRVFEIFRIKHRMIKY